MAKDSEKALRRWWAWKSLKDAETTIHGYGSELTDREDAKLIDAPIAQLGVTEVDLADIDHDAQI